PELDQFLVGQVLGPLARVDAGRREGFRRPGPADAENVGERDLHPLFAREVDANETCHAGGTPSIRGGLCPSVPAHSVGPRPPTGGEPLFPRGWTSLSVRRSGDQPWRCLWRGSVQMTMTRPC